MPLGISIPPNSWEKQVEIRRKSRGPPFHVLVVVKKLQKARCEKALSCSQGRESQLTFLVPGCGTCVYEHRLLKDLLDAVILGKTIFACLFSWEQLSTSSEHQNLSTYVGVRGQISQTQTRQINLTISLTLALDSPSHYRRNVVMS